MPVVPPRFDDYAGRYEHATLTRDAQGVLEDGAWCISLNRLTRLRVDREL